MFANSYIKLMQLTRLGQDSALSELGKTQNVKIDVYKRRNVIKITAAKVKCNQVATAIERLLGDVDETILDFEPFQMAFSGESGFPSNGDGLRAIAATIPAAIEILKSGKKVGQCFPGVFLR